MRIALDISPLRTGHYLQHRVRGTGFYLENLKKALVQYFPQNNYLFFTQGETVPTTTDIVHYPYFEPFFLTLPFFKKYKSAVTIHDLTPIRFAKYFPVGIRGNIKWAIQRFLLKQMDVIITDSESSKKDIIKYTDIPTNNIHVVYLAAGEEFKQIPSTKKKYIQKKYRLPEKFVLYVGDVTWNKNLPRLLEAIQKVNVPLVMVGKALVENNIDKQNPWNKDLLYVQTVIQENKNIIPVGFVPTEDLVALYNAATVFAMPSLYEGFGLPILEAMQSGCPVITTKEGSLPEIARESAYYVDAYTIDNIAEGIKEVFSNKKLQDTLSKKGLEQAKKFSWEKTAKQTNEAYQQ